MVAVDCVECGGEVSLGDSVLPGEIAQCPDCGVELEVLTVAPLTVDLAPEIEEDWGE
jgi:alpha-aminoadipate/glutamate carrier protein LysW